MLLLCYCYVIVIMLCCVYCMYVYYVLLIFILNTVCVLFVHKKSTNCLISSIVYWWEDLDSRQMINWCYCCVIDVSYKDLMKRTSTKLNSALLLSSFSSRLCWGKFEFLHKSALKYSCLAMPSWYKFCTKSIECNPFLFKRNAIEMSLLSWQMICSKQILKINVLNKTCNP